VGYEQLADRAVRLLAAVANTLTKASPEKLKGMEGDVSRLVMCVINSFIHTRRSHSPEVPSRRSCPLLRHASTPFLHPPESS
jgi:hypothetical protein